jgi:hypothetical protein
VENHHVNRHETKTKKKSSAVLNEALERFQITHRFINWVVLVAW